MNASLTVRRAIAGAGLAASLLAASGMAQTPGSLPRTLVMPFEVATREARADWLGEAMAVALGDELRAMGVPALSRGDRVRAMTRLRVPGVPVLSHATVIRLGGIVGATVGVVGRVEAAGDELIVRARALRIDTGRMDGELVERAPRSDLFALAERLGRRLVPGAGPRAEESRAPRPPLAAFEWLIRGLSAAAPAARVPLLGEALAQAPRLDEARFALWEALTDLGEHRRAFDAVNAVPADSAEVRRARFLGAVSRLQLGQLAEAFTTLTGLQRVREDAAIANDLGIAQLRRPAGAPGGGASAYFREAASLEPRDPDLFFNQGYAHWRDREYGQAVNALREVVRRNPAADEAHYVLGAALQASGATDEGAREKDLARRLSSAYEALESKQPGANAVPRGLERVKTELGAKASGQVSDAIVAAGQREQSEAVASRLAAAQRLYLAERDADALAELQRAVYISPYEVEAHLLMGRIYLRAGRPREAIEAFKIGVWSQDTVAARLALAEGYAAARDYAAARAELGIVLQREPGNATARAQQAALPAP